ncbi:MAG: HD-GYP domain-containing protein, partial [Actinomycetota bacterium]|nr:HD-GYP domain-containing protein [Actinomycetota bacterium]
EGLSLVARIIELSLENRLLLNEVRDQLGGTLNVLAEIIDRRLPQHFDHHTLKLADQAIAIGKMLGMTRRDIHELRISALLADIGMLEIPEIILNATRRLAPEELTEIRLHPVKGAQTASDANFSTDVCAAVSDHHERLDGTGYPRHRKGEQIALPARIIAVCDVFNALTSERPQRPKMSTDEAMAEMVRDAGRLYDPQVVRALMKIVGYRAQVASTPKFTNTIEPDVLAQAIGFDS